MNKKKLFMFIFGIILGINAALLFIGSVSDAKWLESDITLWLFYSSILLFFYVYEPLSVIFDSVAFDVIFGILSMLINISLYSVVITLIVILIDCIKSQIKAIK
jgi:hypothetical protein